MSTETLFSSPDLHQFALRGVSPADAAAQVALLRTPPPPIVLDRPCTVGDGIVCIAPGDRPALAPRAEALAADGRVSKFVPASGAATRMFKDLIAALQAPGRPSASAPVRELFVHLDEFPFAEELRRRAALSSVPATEQEERHVLSTLLDDMDYARLPKGLIAFHRARRRPHTAFEDQLLEGAHYTRTAAGTCRMHFTVAPGFRGHFERALADVAAAVHESGGCVLEVTFSEQQPSTDTLALDAAGEPFRLADGSLLFRPGGHGALIGNLQALGGDLVVIKNVDNVLPADASAEGVTWKRILVGYLGEVQQEVFEAIGGCQREEASDATIERALSVAATRFARRPAGDVRSRDEKRRFALEALDRPLRVCGMVRNEGEPGGAPFWVREPGGAMSIQVVESSQVNEADPGQQRIFESSTHFNPVDLVCGVRSWTNELFDLRRFVDPRAVFISRRSHEGRDLSALERPGLWNGAMAGWNTICVEVPASTFAPVKTVFDLLRPQHRRA